MSRKSFAFLIVGGALAAIGCSGETKGDDDDDSSAGATGATGGTSAGGSSGSGAAAGSGVTAGAGGSAGQATGGSAGLSGRAGSGGEAGGGEDMSADADEDGISDEDEGASALRDSDMDGTPDYLDKDSDEDDIADGVESGDEDPTTPPVDTDEDGTPDYLDTDSDGDGVPDATEIANGFDSDGDLIPDYLDDDSDNDDVADQEEGRHGLDPQDSDTDGDRISDGDEGLKDADGDGKINALDDDSDGDGASDKDEAGDKSVDTAPADSDFDGTPDFLDLDSDNDGLPDKQEAKCGRGVEDGDDDGYGDLAEVLIGSDPCDDTDTVLDHGVEFFFVLPYEAPEQDDKLRFVPRVKKADIFFDVDTTGSMGGVLTSLKTGLGSIMTTTRARVTDSAFGVASFEDFPLGGFGDASDEPFHLYSGVTTDLVLAQSATEMLTTGGGSDGPESGYEALFQTATGGGIMGDAGTFGPFTAPGRIGGAQFRPGALPIVVHATDAESHDVVVSGYPTPYPATYGAHGREAALTALQDIGARVITIQNGANTSATVQLTEVSEVTRAVVPPCSFKVTDTTWRCGEDLCCLPEATAPTLGDDGKPECILRYGINQTGEGLADVAADGIDAIIKYTKFDVFAETRDDGDAGTPDTTTFLRKVEANTPDNSFKPPLEPELSCNPVPTKAAFGDSDYDNGFRGFAVGSSSELREGAKLFFTVRARNTTVPEKEEPQLFRAYIDIVDEQTGSVLDTQDVVVIVPAVPGGVGE